MTLIQLRHFITLAKVGSFVKASAQLHITQPALSRSIKALEDELGQLLFDRVGRRIELTPDGRETLQRAERLTEDADQLRHGGRALDSSASGRLRLGLSSGPGMMLTAPLMIHFAQHFPKVQIDVLRANTDTLTSMLRERQIDAMVVDVRSLRPASDLRVDHLSEMKGCFMVRQGHPLADRARVRFDQVSKFPIASTPLSDEMARILVERYGVEGHPQVLVKYTSDEIAHLLNVTERTNTVLLAIRAAGPGLHEVPVYPALDANARFAHITLAHKSEGLYVPVLRSLMRTALR
ncbi:LysR family transcriptional regulator [Ottowia thiooxydans]|uniref:DNA-binding transcriptional LysR family regulator n=1 Tax=Ottowia thiooxydans TaxID=219182 RepID=A0ABV2Q545_9BURK